MHKFIFGGVSSYDIGLITDGSGVWPTAERDEDVQEIPGRDGALVIDNGRYKNTSISYNCLIKDFAGSYDSIAALSALHGYHRLEDTYRPKVYRVARLSKALEPSVDDYKRTATLEIDFDCKPQCFLKSGESAITFTKSGTLSNPTSFTALPLVRVYGTGTLGIGSETIQITKNGSYIDIDCDLQDAYTGTTNQNANITLSSDNFFSLAPGSNGITLGTGITKVEITPRWWKL